MTAHLLERLRFTYRVATTQTGAKKKMIYASERDLERVQKQRVTHRENLQTVVGRLKFLDEAGSNIAMTRACGRAAPGERVYEGASPNYGANITIPACLSAGRTECADDDRRSG